jgi:hypothetical protein
MINKEYLQKLRKEHPEKCKEYHDTYYKKHKKNCIKSVVNYQCIKKREIRKEILNFFGDKCNKCGFNDWRALQIDHVNGLGRREYRKGRNGIIYYRTILKEIKNGSKKYQLLCANCNFIKRYTNNEHN